MPGPLSAPTPTPAPRSTATLAGLRACAAARPRASRQRSQGTAHLPLLSCHVISGAQLPLLSSWGPKVMWQRLSCDVRRNALSVSPLLIVAHHCGPSVP